MSWMVEEDVDRVLDISRVLWEELDGAYHTSIGGCP
jgi:hypothetical protein